MRVRPVLVVLEDVDQSDGVAFSGVGEHRACPLELFVVDLAEEGSVRMLAQLRQAFGCGPVCTMASRSSRWGAPGVRARFVPSSRRPARAGRRRSARSAHRGRSPVLATEHLAAQRLVGEARVLGGHLQRLVVEPPLDHRERHAVVEQARPEVMTE